MLTQHFKTLLSIKSIKKPEPKRLIHFYNNSNYKPRFIQFKWHKEKLNQEEKSFYKENLTEDNLNIISNQLINYNHAPESSDQAEIIVQNSNLSQSIIRPINIFQHALQHKVHKKLVKIAELCTNVEQEEIFHFHDYNIISTRDKMKNTICQRFNIEEKHISIINTNCPILLKG